MSSEFGGSAPWDDGKYYCLCGTETEREGEICYICSIICPLCGEDKEDAGNESCDYCAKNNIQR